MGSDCVEDSMSAGLATRILDDVGQVLLKRAVAQMVRVLRPRRSTMHHLNRRLINARDVGVSRCVGEKVGLQFRSSTRSKTLMFEHSPIESWAWQIQLPRTSNFILLQREHGGHAF